MTEQTKRVAREPTREVWLATAAAYERAVRAGDTTEQIIRAVLHAAENAAPDADAGRVAELVDDLQLVKPHLEYIAELERRIERALAVLKEIGDPMLTGEADSILRGEAP